MRTIIELSKDRCFGCGACFNICPKKAIEMSDVLKEGFLYPSLNQELCVECGKCIDVCPAINVYKEKTINPQTYAVKTEKEIAEKSSTAGFFAVIANYINSIGGWVCGAIYDDEFNVYHTITREKRVIEKMKKSKYVQSDLKDSYVRIKEKLEKGEIVLFSGTPCQVAGLYGFLGREYEKLYTMDVICHGVPSPGMWRKYLDENYDISQIENIDFRHVGNNNYFGSQFLRIQYKNGYEKIVSNKNDSYYKYFQSDLGLRKSCSNCQYAVAPRVGDFSCGDFWGAPKVRPDLIDGRKISIVYINSSKGKNIFNKTEKCWLSIQEIEVKNALVSNRSGVRMGQHPNRTYFFELVKKMEFADAVNKALFPQKFDAIIIGPTFSYNYGAIITYYALYKFLKKYGYNVALTCKPNEFQRQDLWAKFYKERTELVSKEAWEFGDFNRMTDCLILGSDQVWNYDLFKSDHYFLAFAEENIKKISYASSFGFDYLTLYRQYQEKYPIFNKLMKRFDNISVRESDGVRLCEDEFEVKAEHVLDPVFLLEETDYIQLFSAIKDEKQESICVSYYLTPSAENNKLNYLVSDHFGFPIINMTGNQQKWEFSNENTDGGCQKDVTMESWLYNIYRSKFVVTDSFHATCFCIIFRKNFIVRQKDWGLSRLKSLLGLLGLQDRLIQSFDEMKDKMCLVEEMIDYDKVYEKLNLAKGQATNWLLTAIREHNKVSFHRRTDKINDCQLQLVIKETTTLWQYFEICKQYANDYVMVSCANGNEHIINSSMIIKENYDDIMKLYSKEIYYENEGNNLIQDTGKIIVAEGNGRDNCRTLGIELTDYGIQRLKEKENKVYVISFDWEAKSSDGCFKIQLGAAPWDDLTSYIEITADNKAGHYENIYLSSGGITSFSKNELQIRTDKMNGSVLIKNLKLEEGNRATKQWGDTYGINGFAGILDVDSGYVKVLNTSMGKLKYNWQDVSILVEYQNKGFRGCEPNTELYIENKGKRMIYPCEGKGMYMFLFSKSLKTIIDIAFIKNDDIDMEIKHF